MDDLGAAKNIHGVNVVLTGDSRLTTATNPGIAAMALIELIWLAVHVVETPIASGRIHYLFNNLGRLWGKRDWNGIGVDC